MSEINFDWLSQLPKIELHLHPEGSLESEMMFELAKRNNVTIPCKTVEQVRNNY